MSNCPLYQTIFQPPWCSIYLGFAYSTIPMLCCFGTGYLEQVEHMQLLGLILTFRACLPESKSRWQAVVTNWKAQKQHSSEAQLQKPLRVIEVPTADRV